MRQFCDLGIRNIKGLFQRQQHVYDFRSINMRIPEPKSVELYQKYSRQGRGWQVDVFRGTFDGGCYLAMVRERKGCEEGLLRSKLGQNQMHRGR